MVQRHRRCSGVVFFALATAVGLAALVPVGSAVAGGPEDELEISIGGGGLTLAVPSNPTVSFGSVDLTGGDVFTEKWSNWALVGDARGTDEGWTLVGVASDFVGDASGARILAANLGWSPFAQVRPIVDDGLVPDVPFLTTPTVVAGPVVAPAQDAGLSTPKVLCSGDLGASTGQFDCVAYLKLGIPWSTAADHFTSVLTLTLI